MNSENHNTQTSSKNMTLSLLSIACVIVFSVASFVYTMSAPRIMSPKELVNNGAVMYQEPREIQPFDLVTHAEQTFAPENITGKWTMLFFGFTYCPDFCPTTLATLRMVVDQLDVELQKNLQVVMVSVDPARDTPLRLKEYFEGFQFNDEHTDFVGVTGEFVKIKILADHFYIPFQKQMLDMENTEQEMDHSGMDHSEHMGSSGAANNYTMVHGENIALINPEGQYQGFFSPPFTVARLKVTFRSIERMYSY